MMLLNRIQYYTCVCVSFILFAGCTKTEPSAFQKESFIKSFGGAYITEAIDMIKDNGNYFILGNIKDEKESSQIFLTMTDEYGNRVWANDLTYTIDNKQTIAGQIIKLEKQPGYAIIGAIEMDDSLRYFDTYLLIIDDNGLVLTDTVYNNPEYSDYGKCIGELQNGGFTISTLSVSEEGAGNKINLITASSNGEYIRKSTIDGSDLFHVCKKNDNTGFYVSAYTTKPIILLINAEGQYIAPQDYGSNIKGQIRGITQDKSGNTFVCGKRDIGSKGSNDGFIAKLNNVDENVMIDWLYEFGTSGIDYLEQLVITENNEILVTGSTQNEVLDTYDIWVMKTDIIGNYVSQITIGGDNNEYGIRILESDNSKYVVEGTTYLEKNSLITIFKSELK